MEIPEWCSELRISSSSELVEFLLPDILTVTMSSLRIHLGRRIDLSDESSEDLGFAWFLTLKENQFYVDSCIYWLCLGSVAVQTCIYPSVISSFYFLSLVAQLNSLKSNWGVAMRNLNEDAHLRNKWRSSRKFYAQAFAASTLHILLQSIVGFSSSSSWQKVFNGFFGAREFSSDYPYWQSQWASISFSVIISIVSLVGASRINFFLSHRNGIRFSQSVDSWGLHESELEDFNLKRGHKSRRSSVDHGNSNSFSLDQGLVRTALLIDQYFRYKSTAWCSLGILIVTVIYPSIPFLLLSILVIICMLLKHRFFPKLAVLGFPLASILFLSFQIVSYPGIDNLPQWSVTVLGYSSSFAFPFAYLFPHLIPAILFSLYLKVHPAKSQSYELSSLLDPRILFDAIESGDYPALDLIIEENPAFCSVARGSHGETILHTAVYFKQDFIVSMILPNVILRNSLLNQLDDSMKSALDVAARVDASNLCVIFLLSSGISTESIDKASDTYQWIDARKRSYRYAFVRGSLFLLTFFREVLPILILILTVFAATQSAGVLSIVYFVAVILFLSIAYLRKHVWILFAFTSVIIYTYVYVAYIIDLENRSAEIAKLFGNLSSESVLAISFVICLLSLFQQIQSVSPGIKILKNRLQTRPLEFSVFDKAIDFVMSLRRSMFVLGLLATISIWITSSTFLTLINLFVLILCCLQAVISLIKKSWSPFLAAVSLLWFLVSNVVLAVAFASQVEDLRDFLVNDFLQVSDLTAQELGLPKSGNLSVLVGPLIVFFLSRVSFAIARSVIHEGNSSQSLIFTDYFRMLFDLVGLCYGVFVLVFRPSLLRLVCFFVSALHLLCYSWIFSWKWSLSAYSSLIICVSYAFQFSWVSDFLSTEDAEVLGLFPFNGKSGSNTSLYFAEYFLLTLCSFESPVVFGITWIGSSFVRILSYLSFLKSVKWSHYFSALLRYFQVLSLPMALMCMNLNYAYRPSFLSVALVSIAVLYSFYSDQALTFLRVRAILVVLIGIRTCFILIVQAAPDSLFALNPDTRAFFLLSDTSTRELVYCNVSLILLTLWLLMKSYDVHKESIPLFYLVYLSLFVFSLLSLLSILFTSNLLSIAGVVLLVLLMGTRLKRQYNLTKEILMRRNAVMLIIIGSFISRLPWLESNNVNVTFWLNTFGLSQLQTDRSPVYYSILFSMYDSMIRVVASPTFSAWQGSTLLHLKSSIYRLFLYSKEVLFRSASKVDRNKRNFRFLRLQDRWFSNEFFEQQNEPMFSRDEEVWPQPIPDLRQHVMFETRLKDLNRPSLLVDQQNSVVECSNDCVLLFSLSQQEIIGIDCVQLFPEIYREEVSRMVQECFSLSSLRNPQMIVQFSDGSVYSMTALPKLDELEMSVIGAVLELKETFLLEDHKGDPGFGAKEVVNSIEGHCFVSTFSGKILAMSNSFEDLLGIPFQASHDLFLKDLLDLSSEVTVQRLDSSFDELKYSPDPSELKLRARLLTSRVFGQDIIVNCSMRIVSLDNDRMVLFVVRVLENKFQRKLSLLRFSATIQQHISRLIDTKLWSHESANEYYDSVIFFRNPSSVFHRFALFLFSQLHWIYFFNCLILLFLFPSVMSTILVVAFLIYPAIDEFRGSVSFWRLSIIFNAVYLVLQFIYQLDIFCTQVNGLYAIAPSPNCLVVQTGISSSGRERRIGLFKLTSADLASFVTLLSFNLFWILLYLYEKKSLGTESISSLHFSQIRSSLVNPPSFRTSWITRSLEWIRSWIPFASPVLQLLDEIFPRDSRGRYDFNRKPGRRFFEYYVGTLIFCIPYSLFLWPVLSGSEASLQDSVSSSFFSEGIVLFLFFLFIVLLLERVIFLRKDVIFKFILNCFYIVVINWLVIFNWVDTDSSQFNAARIIFYLLQLLYILLSCLQVKYGFRFHEEYQFVARKASDLRKIGLILYRIIPFLYEIQAVLDWMVIPSALRLSQAMNLDEVFIRLYNMKVELIFWRRQPRGYKYKIMEKLLFALYIFVLMLFCVLGPLIIFSSLNPQVTNAVVQTASISLSITSPSNSFELFSGSSIASINQVSSLRYSFLRSQGFVTIQSNQGVQDVTMSSSSDSIWTISPSNYALLLQDLNRSGTSNLLKFSYAFVKNGPDSSPSSSGFSSRALSQSESLNLLSFLSSSSPRESITLNGIFPSILRLPSSGKASDQDTV